LPGTLPGPLGIAAFAGIKFAGYWFAVSAVKHFETAMVASAVKVAAVRTVRGFVLGPPVALAGVLLAETLFFRSRFSSFEALATYSALSIARIFIWALLLYLFTRKVPLLKSKLWLYALLGAAVSSLLDLPAYALAIATPGQIVFC
jgi:hypothetical protein